MKKIDQFQEHQLEELNSCKSYQEACTYIVLLDLIRGSDIEEVYLCLNWVAQDFDLTERLYSKIEEIKTWKSLGDIDLE